MRFTVRGKLLKVESIADLSTGSKLSHAQGNLIHTPFSHAHVHKRQRMKPQI